MKVKIGPYKNWFGPYQLAEALCFWVKPVKDEYGIPDKPKWVHKFGELLAYGKLRKEPEIGEIRDWDDDRKETWLYKLLKWIDSKKKRQVYVHIDRWDTWSMDSTLAYIIRPMLHQLKKTTHGAPFVDDEDVPEELRSTSARELTQDEKDTGHVDDNHFKRWEWVMDEMIFAFESLDGGPNQDWEDQFETGESDLQWVNESDLQWVKQEDGNYQMVSGPAHTREYDWEGRKKYQERISNGFRLFGKYYQNLWD